MSDLIQRHVESLDATATLLRAQIDALRFALKTQLEPKPIERDPLPARCINHDPARCALQRGEWKDISNFTAPNARRCMECGFDDAMLGVSGG